MKLLKYKWTNNESLKIVKKIVLQLMWGLWKKASRDYTWKGFLMEYLKCITGVTEAIYTDIIFQPSTSCRCKENQFQALWSSHAEWFSHQRKAAQLLSEDVASLGFQLAMEQFRRSWVSQLQYVLRRWKRKKIATSEKEKWQKSGTFTWISERRREIRANPEIVEEGA